MTPKGLILLLGATLLALPGTSWGQKPSTWPVNARVFRMADGLAESACISCHAGPAREGPRPAPQVRRHQPTRRLHRHVPPRPGHGQQAAFTRAPAASSGRSSPRASRSSGTTTGCSIRFRRSPPNSATASPRLIDPVPLCPVRQGVVLFLLPDRLLAIQRRRPRPSPHRGAAHGRADAAREVLGHDPGPRWRALDCRRARACQSLGAGSQSQARTANGTTYLPPESLQLTISRSRTEDEEGSVTALAESAERINRSCWPISTASIGQPRRSPSKRSGYAWRGAG